MEHTKATQRYQKIALILAIICMIIFLVGFDASDGVYSSDDDGPAPVPSESIQRFGEVLLVYVFPICLVLFGIFGYLFVRHKEKDVKKYLSKSRDERLNSWIDKPSVNALSFCPDCGDKVINRPGSPYQWCENCKKHIQIK